MANGIGNEDMAFIKDMLLRLSDKQKEMDDTLTEVAGTVNKLQSRIIGDPTYNQKGLVDEVNKLTSYVEADKRQNNRIYGGLVVIVGLWTVVWEYIKSKF